MQKTPSPIRFTLSPFICFEQIIIYLIISSIFMASILVFLSEMEHVWIICALCSIILPKVSSIHSTTLLFAPFHNLFPNFRPKNSSNNATNFLFAPYNTQLASQHLYQHSCKYYYKYSSRSSQSFSSILISLMHNFCETSSAFLY